MVLDFRWSPPTKVGLHHVGSDFGCFLMNRMAEIFASRMANIAWNIRVGYEPPNPTIIAVDNESPHRKDIEAYRRVPSLRDTS